jgi:hypothetical protein
MTKASCEYPAAIEPKGATRDVKFERPKGDTRFSRHPPNVKAVEQKEHSQV